MPNSRAIVRSTALLAAPLAGAARTLTRSSPSSPTQVTSSSPARGVTRTVKTTAFQRNTTSCTRNPRTTSSTSGDQVDRAGGRQKAANGCQQWLRCLEQEARNRSLVGGVHPADQDARDDDKPKHSDEELNEDDHELRHGASSIGLASGDGPRTEEDAPEPNNSRPLLHRDLEVVAHAH